MTDKYTETLQYLYRLRNLGSKFDLETMRTLLSALDNPQKRYKVVHIAGSKGKGSVAAMLASILEKAGYKTGLYTSPHLVSYTERIKVNNSPISKEEVVKGMKKLSRISAKLLEKGLLNRQPTFFELTTALAFSYFEKKDIDIAIVEVGLGGRLDATNVVEPPLVAVITTIELEHTNILGDNLRKIAFEKCGILKSGTPYCVTGVCKKTPLKVIQSFCKNKNIDLLQLGTHFDYKPKQSSLNGQTFEFYDYKFNTSRTIKLNLLGQEQLMNASVAATVIDILQKHYGFQIAEEAVKIGFSSANWHGRFELLTHRNTTYLFDCAHTPASANALAKNVENTKSQLNGKKITAIIGIAKDKNINGIACRLGPLFDRVIVTRFDSDRCCSPEVVMQEFKKYCEVTITENVEDALQIAKENHNVVLIAGSSYLVGEAMQILDFNWEKENIRLQDPVGTKKIDVESVIEGLKKLFPERKFHSSKDAFKVLIATMLSHRTRDENTHRATQNLFSVYKDAQSIANAPESEIQKLIRPCGFYREKAKKIKKVANIICTEYNGKVPEELDALLKLPGVGRKTANCVLVFAFNKPALPVDTHVHRISNRLGWVVTKTPEETEHALKLIVPKKYWLDLNELFVRFGQTICKPVKPYCEKCSIKKFCSQCLK